MARRDADLADLIWHDGTRISRIAIAGTACSLGNAQAEWEESRSYLHVHGRRMEDV